MISEAIKRQLRGEALAKNMLRVLRYGPWVIAGLLGGLALSLAYWLGRIA